MTESRSLGSGSTRKRVPSTIYFPTPWFTSHYVYFLCLWTHSLFRYLILKVYGHLRRPLEPFGNLKVTVGLIPLLGRDSILRPHTPCPSVGIPEPVQYSEDLTSIVEVFDKPNLKNLYIISTTTTRRWHMVHDEIQDPYIIQRWSVLGKKRSPFVTHPSIRKDRNFTTLRQ